MTNKKVLVIDDDRLSLTLIRFALKESRFNVVTAEDGQEGLKAVHSESPDLIVLDIQMPNMSGFEFMNELKATGKSIPVIMLTANENMQEIFLSEGVKGYFVKPVEPSTLVAKIRECLA